jgi:hypothetical protein
MFRSFNFNEIITSGHFVFAVKETNIDSLNKHDPISLFFYEAPENQPN